MMRLLTSCVLVLLFVALAGCSRQRVRDADGIDRMGGYTLGLVVFGDDSDHSPADRSARYIIEPGGVFRASFGDGSTALTYPPITRRLSEEQLDSVWALVERMRTGESSWRLVSAPELFLADSGSSGAYLFELGDPETNRAWSAPIDEDSARALAARLAALAWVTD